MLVGARQACRLQGWLCLRLSGAGGPVSLVLVVLWFEITFCRRGQQHPVHRELGDMVLCDFPISKVVS